MEEVLQFDEESLDSLGITAICSRKKIMASVRGPDYVRAESDTLPAFSSTTNDSFMKLKSPSHRKPQYKTRPHLCTPDVDEDVVSANKTAYHRNFPVQGTFSNQVVLHGHPIDLPYQQDRAVYGNLITYWVSKVFFDLWQVLFHAWTTFHLFGFFDLLVLTLSVAGFQWCYSRDLYVQLNPNIFMNSVVFPLSFAIWSAFNRREKALEDLSVFKGATLSMLLLYRDWKDFTKFQEFENGKEFLFTAGDVIIRMFNAVREYLLCEYEPKKRFLLNDVYIQFSDISALTESLRSSSSVPPPLFTRLIRDLQFIITGFEKLRVAADYRTPMALRCYINLWIIAMTIALTPYHAFLGQSNWYVALGGAIVVPLSFLCLRGVQIQLEYLFGSHVDDISLAYLRNMEVVSATVTPYHEEEAYIKMHAALVERTRSVRKQKYRSGPKLQPKTFTSLSADSDFFNMRAPAESP
eukprot:TRINITY_DN67873_c3_g3_i1.p1 TRINITY_DN67873_c3_g3~~TRINITY_DN67873_c3_g3_i1.p1  ORF type:complete len:465 (-),score=10.46 TRINITY_DN67873_c3_g3_i1:159-1553(-)